MNDEAKRRRNANLRPFRPGQSGNPGGRSKAQIDLRNAARAYTTEAIETLVLVMRNGKPSEAAMAANALLDRGWGKPAQQVNAEIKRNLYECPTGELLAFLAGYGVMPTCNNDELDATEPGGQTSELICAT